MASRIPLPRPRSYSGANAVYRYSFGAKAGGCVPPPPYSSLKVLVECPVQVEDGRDKGLRGRWASGSQQERPVDDQVTAPGRTTAEKP